VNESGERCLFLSRRTSITQASSAELVDLQGPSNLPERNA
jgi:hypothetical protein